MHSNELNTSQTRENLRHRLLRLLSELTLQRAQVAVASYKRIGVLVQQPSTSAYYILRVI